MRATERAAFLHATDLETRRSLAVADPAGGEWRAVVSHQPLARCAKYYRQGCAITWEQHTPTDDDLQRKCGTCRRAVFYCTTMELLERLGSTAPRCIALDLALDENAAKDLYDRVRAKT